MKEKVRFLGLDVHAGTIAVAIAEPDGAVRSLGTIPNRMESIRKMVKKLGAVEQLRACYEAGPTGYVLYWQLTELGVECAAIAPTLVPMKAGDRVKTDRRDAERLARSYQPGWKARRWVVERTHSWLNRYRKLLVSFEKSEASYVALLSLAAALICWRQTTSIYG